MEEDIERQGRGVAEGIVVDVGRRVVVVEPQQQEQQEQREQEQEQQQQQRSRQQQNEWPQEDQEQREEGADHKTGEERRQQQREQHGEGQEGHRGGVHQGHGEQRQSNSGNNSHSGGQRVGQHDAPRRRERHEEMTIRLQLSPEELVPDSELHTVKYHGMLPLAGLNATNPPTSATCISSIRTLCKYHSKERFRNGVTKYLVFQVSCRQGRVFGLPVQEDGQGSGISHVLARVACASNLGPMFCYVVASVENDVVTCNAHVFECESRFASSYLCNELVKACRVILDALRSRGHLRDQQPALQDDPETQKLMKEAGRLLARDMDVLSSAVQRGQQTTGPLLHGHTQSRAKREGMYFVCCRSYKECKCRGDAAAKAAAGERKASPKQTAGDGESKARHGGSEVADTSKQAEAATATAATATAATAAAAAGHRRSHLEAFNDYSVDGLHGKPVKGRGDSSSESVLHRDRVAEFTGDRVGSKDARGKTLNRGNADDDDGGEDSDAGATKSEVAARVADAESPQPHLTSAVADANGQHDSKGRRPREVAFVALKARGNTAAEARMVEMSSRTTHMPEGGEDHNRQQQSRQQEDPPVGEQRRHRQQGHNPTGLSSSSRATSSKPKRSSVSMSSLQEGHVVFVKGHGIGVLRFYGQSRVDPSVKLIGVEFTDPKGDCDGESPKHGRYFTCTRNHGLLFSPGEKEIRVRRSPSHVANANV